MYAAVHGVGGGKVTRAMRAIKSGGVATCFARKTSLNNAAPSPSAEPGTPVEDDAKNLQCFTFWKHLFDTQCGKPNDQERLFPIDLSYTQIYKQYFEPWWSRTYSVRQGPSIPHYSTWMRARHDAEFDDVARRAKHFHARCITCSCLRTQLLLGFEDGKKMEEYYQARRLHDEERDGGDAPCHVRVGAADGISS